MNRTDNSERWSRIKEIFKAAIAHGPDDRFEYLNEACKGDEDLRKEVEELIISDTDAGDFLETPAVVDFSDDRAGERLVGGQIGQYKLKRIISTGGMGVVYEAEQENPNRTVAVKVMKEHIGSSSAQRRFEYESQILARLNHPGIAQVFDAGAHIVVNNKDPDKIARLPYFVMEYIYDAKQITEYAWKKRLNTRERLALFIQVCDAVQHGHQKGVIHRDLKPGNILVNSDGQVKIIDFGIARATDSDMLLTTQHTHIGELIGTLQYMSPEQCKADPHDLDIRSDVYALGIVLYEMLCEELPYDVRKAAMIEAVRRIIEEPPKRPSSVKRTLQGDVETIILKSLEKERNLRYQSLADFSADLSRYLKGEVIQAKPAHLGTRFWKMTKRNPVLSSSVGLALTFLVTLFMYIVLWSYPQIKAEKDKTVLALKTVQAEKARAISAEKEASIQRNAAVAAQMSAEKEAKKVLAINKFLKDTFYSPAPSKDGFEVKVVDVLDRAARKVGRSFKNQPEIEASLREILGWTYNGLGRYQESEEQHKAADEIYNRILGPEHIDTTDNLVKLASSVMSQKRYEEAESLMRQALDINTQILGEEHGDTLYAKSFLANMFIMRRQYEEAESMLNETLKVQRAVLGENNDVTRFTMNALGRLYMEQARYNEAEAILRIVVKAHSEQLDEDHPTLLGAKNNLALALRNLGEYGKAELMFRDVADIHRRISGEEHPHTVSAQYNLASVLQYLGRYSEAEALLRRVVEIRIKTLGENNVDTLKTRGHLASIIGQSGDLSKAESELREVLRSMQKSIGPKHPTTLSTMGGLASILVAQKKYSEAEAHLKETIELCKNVHGENHPKTVAFSYKLAHMLKTNGEYFTAETIFREILSRHQLIFKKPHPESIRIINSLAATLLLQDKLEECAKMCEKGVAMAQEILPEKHLLNIQLKSNYGACLLYMDQLEKAEKILNSVYKSSSAVWGKRHIKTCYIASRLVELYETLNNQDEIVKWRAVLEDSTQEKEM